jgi:hypothetical protein
MKLQTICEQYAAFRKTLGERFEVNGRQLKAFCRAMGPNLDIADVSSEKVNTFLVGNGPLTTSWYVRHNALLGFYRYAISRGLVTTSPLPLAIHLGGYITRDDATNPSCFFASLNDCCSSEWNSPKRSHRDLHGV